MNNRIRPTLLFILLFVVLQLFSACSAPEEKDQPPLSSQSGQLSVDSQEYPADQQMDDPEPISELEENVSESFSPGQETTGELSFDDAINKVIADAKINSNDIVKIEARYDNDHGTNVCKIELKTVDTKYEYRFSVETGEILKRETRSSDDDDYRDYSNNDNKTSIHEALDLALQDANVNKDDVVHFDIELEAEDNRPIYNINVRTQNKHYQLIVDSQTRKVDLVREDNN